MRILAIAAHPDDEVLGCGATLSRLAGEGNEVYICILGEGVTSRYKKREEAEKGLMENLREKALRVRDLLGAKALFHFSLPDNRFDTLPLLDIVKMIEEVIGKLKPQALFTHSACDLNIDHAVTHRAALTATRPQKAHPVKDIYTFEIPSSTEWAFGEFGDFRPNVFFDVKGTIEVKTSALQIYESELREFPHPRSVEALKTIAKRWGSAIDADYAEAFHLVRSVR